MNTGIQRLLAAATLAVMVAACQSGGAPVSGPVSIKTPAAPPQACMDALATGVLAVNAKSGLGLETAGGEVMAVEWPFGYTARNSLGTIELVDETGKVVAKAGDEITVGGGFGNEFWHACGPVSVVVP